MATASRRLSFTNGKANAPSKPDLMSQPAAWEFDYSADQHWPESPNGLGITSQLMWVTPEIAAEWVESGKLAKIQRSLKKLHLDALCDDHLAGRFMLNCETIIFDWDGNCCQGQHRIQMVIRTGRPALFMVIRGVSPDVYPTFDNTAKRSKADALKSRNISNAANVGAAATLLERYARGIIGKGNIVQSPIAAAEFVVNQHPGLEQSATATGVFHKEFPAASAFTMCHYVLQSVDARACDDFFNRLHTGANLEEDSPILKLRMRLYRNKGMRADEVIQLIFKAWNYWRNGRRLPGKAQLKFVDGETMHKPV